MTGHEGRPADISPLHGSGAEGVPSIPRWSLWLYAILVAGLIGVAILSTGSGVFRIGAGIAALTLLAILVPAWTTVVTNDGISHLTILGHQHVAWDDVVAIEWGAKGSAVLKTRTTTFRLPLIFFSDYDAAVSWIVARLPHLAP